MRIIWIVFHKHTCTHRHTQQLIRPAKIIIIITTIHIRFYVGTYGRVTYIINICSMIESDVRWWVLCNFFGSTLVNKCMRIMSIFIQCDRVVCVYESIGFLLCVRLCFCCFVYRRDFPQVFLYIFNIDTKHTYQPAIIPVQKHTQTDIIDTRIFTKACEAIVWMLIEFYANSQSSIQST